MKYEVNFSVSISDKEGFTRINWWATHTIGVEHLSELSPMLTSVERIVEEWRRVHPPPDTHASADEIAARA